MIKNIFKIGINLMFVCLVGGTILAATNFITAPKIEEIEKETKLKVLSVLLTANQFKEIKPGFFEGLNAKGETVGYVISYLAQGYCGGFWVMAGVNKEFKIVRISVMSNKETPGLGTKIEEDKFRNQFKGKGMENLEVVKTPTADKIQAITGATISSQAVTEAVKKGLEELKRIVKKSR
ncbi:MAG: RnfABCDGE type electron transport complex subunit G [bacterium]|nr:RnfABCDGE type electron transport complex subunit G [bacterium]